MGPNSLSSTLQMPPTLVDSDLPLDKELLQRWTLNSTTPHGTPASGRPPSYPKRSSSFDSPREIPLPSPSLFSSGNAGMSSFSKFNGATPSAPKPAVSPLLTRTATDSEASMDYFNAFSSHHQRPSPEVPKPGESSTSPASSSSSSSGNSASISSSLGSRVAHSKGYQAGRYSLSEGQHFNDTASDYTSQTTPSPVSESDDRLPSNPTVGHGRKESMGKGGGAVHTLSDLASQPSSRFPHAPNLQASLSYSGKHEPMTQSFGQSGSVAKLGATNPSPIFPTTRPFSLQEASTTNPRPVNYSDFPFQRYPDRSSSASLPLPAHVPFHVLPRFGMHGLPMQSSGNEALDEALGIGPSSTIRDFSAGAAHAARVRTAHEEEVGKLPPTTAQQLKRQREQQQQRQRDLQSPPPHLQGIGMTHASPWAFLEQHQPQPQRHEPQPPRSPVAAQPQPRQQQPPISPPPSSSQKRSVSPFRAPQPRYAASPLNNQPSMNPRTSPRTHQHTPSTGSHQSYQSHQSTTSPGPGPAFFSPSASAPAPDPPTILPPTVSNGPFLSHAPPPPGCWIEIDTHSTEYKLTIRLPGFTRDGITLATKRRRVLHVVADSWEHGGGHFERRIAFGYDADLIQVRAEFDGEILRVTIPRRVPPLELWGARVVNAPRPGAPGAV